MAAAREGYEAALRVNEAHVIGQAEARTLLKMPGPVGTVVSAVAPWAALAGPVGDR